MNKKKISLNKNNVKWNIENGEVFSQKDFICFLNVSNGAIQTSPVEIEGKKEYIISLKFRIAMEVVTRKNKNDYISNFLKNHPFYWQIGVDEALLEIHFYNKKKLLSSVKYPIGATSTFFWYDFVKYKNNLKKGWVDTWIKIETPSNAKFLKILLKIRSKNDVKGGFGIGKVFLIEKEKFEKGCAKITLKTFNSERKLTPCKVSIYSFKTKSFFIPSFEFFYEYPSLFLFNLEGEKEIFLPEGRYLIEVCKGFTYSVEKAMVYLSEGSKKVIEFTFKKRVKNNWISSDHHVHLFGHFNTFFPFINDEVMKNILKAEGLDFVMWGRNYLNWKKERVKNKILIEKGIELVSHRYGHFCLINLNKKIKNFPDPFKEYPPLWKYLKMLNKNKTAIVAAHPVQTIKVGEDIVKEENEVVEYIKDINRWNLNKILPLLLLMKIPCGFDVVIGDGAGTFYTFLREYFRLLNFGFKVAACGSTDSNVDMKDSFNPVGSARTYLCVENTTIEEVSKAYREGHTFATNGPLIFPSVENSYIPGDEIYIEKEKELKIKFDVCSSFGLSFVECYYNGELINKFDFSGHREGKKEFEINIDKSGWINFVVRGPGNKWVNSWMIPEEERMLFGQICITTPFYFYVKNKPYRPPKELINYYLKWFENLKILIEKFEIKKEKKEEILEEINKYIKKIFKDYCNKKVL